MKQNGYSVSDQHIDILIDELGDEHVSTSVDTPLRADAFELSDDEKIEKIATHFGSIMDILGLDRTDDSLSGTPRRVAKMYVKEVFSGLNPENFPDIKLFENKYQYNQMLVEKNILFYSNCEHHFVPIIGKAHVAYISSGKVIGLSKINRIVQHFAKRPQVQERLTSQIADAMQNMLDPVGVLVVVEAEHTCMSLRGVRKPGTKTVTTAARGIYRTDTQSRAEVMAFIQGR